MLTLFFDSKSSRLTHRHVGGAKKFKRRTPVSTSYTPIPNVSSLWTFISSSSSAMACSPESISVPPSPSLQSSPFSGHCGSHTCTTSWCVETECFLRFINEESVSKQQIGQQINHATTRVEFSIQLSPSVHSGHAMAA